ncbi:hypothetical protein BU15DRAFT_64471 [Melanogaster broomeanus]|nr:hypothetical protein BU15DRAFT_64471 [Melanogaster broomeanus]
MNYPPKYSDLVLPSSIPAPETLHAFLSHDHSYTVHDWYEILVTTAAQNSSKPQPTYLLRNLLHYKCWWDGVEHECLLLNIMIKHPGVILIPLDKHYIRVTCTINAPGLFSQMGLIHSNAYDIVTLIQDGAVEIHGLCRELEWPPLLAPNLVDISKILDYVSNVYPKDSISSPQCCYFTRTAYDVIQTIFKDDLQYYTKNWHSQWYHVENTKSIKLSENIVTFLKMLQRHQEMEAAARALPDLEVDKEANIKVISRTQL